MDNRTIVERPDQLLVICNNQEAFTADNKIVTLLDLNTGKLLRNNYANVILLEVLYMKPAKRDNSWKADYKNVGTKKSEYDKLMVVRDVNGVAGSNVGLLPLGNKHNVALFEDVLPFRDEGIISPSTMFAIESPPLIMSHSNGLPIIETPMPAIPVTFDQETYRLREVPISDHSRSMQAFFYGGAVIPNFSAQLIKCDCIGPTCDAQFVYGKNGLTNSCCCYQADVREAKIVAVFDLEIQTAARPELGIPSRSIPVFHFTSKKFTKFFMRNQTAPLYLEDVNLHQRRVMASYNAAVRRIFEEISNKGGFNVTGWVKPGVIVDQGIVNNSQGKSSYNASTTKTDSSSRTYHVTSITPSRAMSSFHDLEPMRFDPRTVHLHRQQTGQQPQGRAGMGRGPGDNDGVGNRSNGGGSHVQGSDNVSVIDGSGTEAASGGRQPIPPSPERNPLNQGSRKRRANEANSTSDDGSLV